MTKVGTRVFYDESDGRIVSTIHRLEGGIPRAEIVRLAYLDIPYEEFDPLKYDITHIENGRPVLISTQYETDEQRQIRELEDALLLQAEAESGGIL